MVLPEWAGLAVLAMATLFMFLIVPWERIKELALVGLLGGLGIAFVLTYVMFNLGFWTFSRVDPIKVQGVPIILAAGWYPVIIGFSHLLAQYKNLPLLILIVLAFPLGATLVHLLLIQNGMLFYHNWNLPLTFLVALVLHLAVMGYLYATGRLDNVRRLIRA